MGNKNKTQRSEGDDFREMKELGFELESPQDTYSDQPGSGSTIGGVRGEQEYGIDTSVDAQGRGSQMRSQSNVAFDSSEPSRTPESEAISNEAGTSESVNISDLKTLIEDRLDRNPHFSAREYNVSVNGGAVTISGEVTSHSSKLLIDELLSSFPEVREIYNNVQVVL